MKRALALLALVAGCGGNDLTLKYKLDGVAPADVVRVETRVDVDPSDPRAFYVDQPYRQVATGVGYEVRDFDGSGKKTLLVTHDSTLGYVFSDTFDFRLLPPAAGSAPPLSIVARAVGLSDMIGQTMPLAGKFGRGAKLTVDLTDQRCGAMSCDANDQCCGGACAAVQSDAANCGSCGHACAPTGDSCSGATCRCAGGSACASGSTCCGGIGCVDLKSDPFHCGACDKACAPGEACVAGACKCGGGAACTGATAVCCDGTTCSASGTCMCGSTTCNFPDVCCGSTCVDPRSSNTNCGGCGKACTAPLICANGACACSGVICANGDTCCGAGCANTSNDPNNCGSCGKKCRAGEVCGGGQCLCGSTACSTGQLCCGGACVNQTVTNCGTCGHICKSGEQCNASPTTGSGNTSCTCNGNGACVGNQICCAPGSPGGAGCFDPSSDAKHCGDCATVCPAGQGCVTGKCAPTACNPPCTNGNQCEGGVCRCNGKGDCKGADTCCLDGCHDLATDHDNCNMCGHACGGTEYCCKGACTKQDDNNCSACGAGCSAGSCCVCPGRAGHCASLLCTCL
jgi:hypothetical protein